MSTVVDEMVVKWSIDDTNYTSGLNSIDKKMKLVKSEFGATDSKLQAFGSTLDKLKSKQEYLTKTLTLQEQKVKSLKDAYERTKKETGENSEASQKLATKLNTAIKYYNKLENELKQTTNKLNEEEKEIQKNGSAWTKLSKVASTANEKMSKGFEKIKSGAAKIGTAFTAVTGIGAAFANEYEKSLNKFQASVGASKDEMEEFSNVIKDVYGDNFGESFEDVADSVQVVNKYLNLTGDDLKNITELSLGFRDSFGVETNESIRSCKALMDNFGISAEEAFNLLVQGEQSGLDYSGELIDNVNEYSVQFGKLGLSAEDMFNIFESGSNAGAFNLDKIGDAVKEFSIRAIDGSNTTIDGFTKLGLNVDDMASKFAKGGDSAKNAFYQVIEGIRNINDPVEQSLVGVDLFGTMWEDLGPQVVTSLDSIKNGFDKTKSSADDLNNVQYNNLGDGLKLMWREIQTECLTPLSTELMPKFNEVFEKVREKMPQIKEIIGNTVSKLANIIGFLIDHIDTVIPIAKGALAVFLGFKAINGVNSVFKTVTQSVDNFKKGIELVKGLNITPFINGLKTALSGVSKILGVIMAHPVIAGITLVVAGIVLLWNKCEWFRNGVLGLFEWLKNAFTAVCNVFKTVWNATINVLQTVFNAFVVVFKLAWEVIKTVVNVAVGFIKQIWQGLCSLLMPILQPILDSIKLAWEGFKLVFSIICNALGQVWNSICNTFSDVWAAVTNTLGQVWNNVCNTFSSVWNSVTSTIGSIWEVVTSRISIVWNGIVGAISFVWQGWCNIFGSVCNTISGIWNGITETIMGVWNGIVERVKSAWETIIQPFQWVVDKISGIWDTIRSYIKLPHFNVEGDFSLNPPSVPTIGVDWYWKGGIFKSPTILGGIGVGDRYKGAGSNAEAVIPLDSMYSNLRNIIKQETNSNSNEQNIVLQCILDSKLIGEECFKIVDNKLVKQRKRVR